MLGASVLKLFKYGFALSGAEIAAILIGLAVAYLVSLAAIRFLMDFVKKHSFTAFGCYRIVLGALVLLITLV
jgi:undecaprenyl-diphosphatase